MPDPTPEQEAVISESSHCVVVARPGSGKTFTLARKLKGILDGLPEHKGVVAISFTNKASDELKQRCLASGVLKKASFFGTIDKFSISELLAFLPHIIGKCPPADLQIIRLPKDQPGIFADLLASRRTELSPTEVDEICRLYVAGQLPLELVGKLGVYVLDKSVACQRYLKARYSHIAIDEYQDSGFEQHEVFLRMKNLGITAIAVGDLDQSIYAFSKRSSEFLSSLTRDASFKPYAITRNHRCHESIVFYSLRLINANIQAAEPTDIRVYDKTVLGSESAVAAWIDSRLEEAKTKFGIVRNSDVAVLFRSNRSGELLALNLRTPHKLFAGTPFDEDNSLWGAIFQKVLSLIFDLSTTKYEVVEEYLSVDFDPRVAKICLRVLRELQEIGASGPAHLKNHIDKFVEVARTIYPHAEHQTALTILRAVLDDVGLLASFIPAQSGQVQLMTLHKSKGLEFDIVFHLDLHQWILPGFKSVKGDQAEFTQDLNLHYVGVTRAKKCVVLCSSTKRTNSFGKILDATPSEFLSRNGVDQFRKHL